MTTQKQETKPTPSHDQTNTIKIESWMKHDHADCSVVSAIELVALEALVLYVANTSKQPTFRIERQLANQFNIPNIKCLPSSQYEKAVRYMANLVPTTKAA